MVRTLPPPAVGHRTLMQLEAVRRGPPCKRDARMTVMSCCQEGQWPAAAAAAAAAAAEQAAASKRQASGGAGASGWCIELQPPAVARSKITAAAAVHPGSRPLRPEPAAPARPAGGQPLAPSSPPPLAQTKQLASCTARSVTKFTSHTPGGTAR